MIVAAAQLRSSAEWQQNLANARSAIERAARDNARLVVLPELFLAWKPGRPDAATLKSLAQPLDGPFVSGLAETARQAGVWVVCGALESAPEGDERSYNTTVVLDESGELVASYRKTHLFDAFGWRESDTFRPGSRLFQPMRTPLGCTGLMVCYELRFPEIARHLVDDEAEVLIVPSAWVSGPNKVLQWRTLVTARAIENGAYVVAANQVGNDFSGASMVIDPMGVTLAEAGTEEEALICAEIDSQQVAYGRAKVPSLQHRRPELYRR